MKIYQVDTFVTGKRFSGNPAGVCILEKPAAETWMQGVAGEMNLAETAFLLKNEDAFELRWFTPVKEVDLCGHATLASAHILWEFGFLKRNEKARFNTKSGLLSAKSLGAGKIELDFPEEIAEECPLPETVKNALEIEALWCGKNRMDYLIEAPSEEILMNLKPDFKLLTEVPCRGFLVTSKSNSSRFDFVSRCFFRGTELMRTHSPALLIVVWVLFGEENWEEIN